jgi:trafficking protein particle complex subunit 9
MALVGAELHTVEELSCIRVVLLPVGLTPFDYFESYARLLADEATQINLGELDSADLPGVSQAFPHQHGRWDRAQLSLSFLGPDHEPSPWDPLQAHRCPLAVLGICHSPSNPDLMEAWEGFLHEVQSSPQWRAALAVHFLVFDTPDGTDGSLLRGAPVGVTLHLLPSHLRDPAGARARVGALRRLLGAELVRGLEQLVATVDTARHSLLTPNEATVDALDEGLLRRRRAGRVCKRQGDLCLLAGCVQVMRCSAAPHLQPDASCDSVELEAETESAE